MRFEGKGLREMGGWKGSEKKNTRGLKKIRQPQRKEKGVFERRCVRGGQRERERARQSDREREREACVGVVHACLYKASLMAGWGASCSGEKTEAYSDCF